MRLANAEDSILTKLGDLRIFFLGHASLMFTWEGLVVHVDPVLAEADYSGLPKADIVLITHDHFDHLDPKAVAALHRPSTEIVGNAESKAKIPHTQALKNGEKISIQGVGIEAVPAYNITGLRAEGVPFHPKGVGNGYVLTFANIRVYVAGDTENTPEMKALTNIDIAFLPMMRPYAMSPEMIADAARALRPKILYPYHTKDADAEKLRALLADLPGIDVRFRYGRR
ncbi:MAG: MBL fold metallo-hydrolase [Candidatus Aminicenantes bacterium]|nr:MBL fold metallo-hydrolase [Candidatus Aminicenantes bacterium]